MADKINIIFIGTADFGIPAFKALVKDRQFNLTAVITQPDAAVGRKQIITPTPIKVEAKKYQIPIFQPKKISAIEKKIKKLMPDIIAVVAYAQLIPKEILDIPKYGCINIHGSLLPKYRGAAVVQAPILNNDEQAGVTIIKMDEGLDTGPILNQAKINIQPNENADTLYNKLSLLGAEIIVNTLKKYIAGKIKLIQQDNAKASYAKRLKKIDGLINWNNAATKIECFIRAMTSWPSAWTEWNDKQIKIIEVQKQPMNTNKHKLGKIFIYNNKLAIQCKKDALIIEKLQLAGKKETTGEEFIRGHYAAIV